ncbi:type II toxin-antitoxin system RelE/ParE family toxin [Emticicia oligotrophica]|uniref:type II toxin-antitoxin system RelE family toxin n=1 Tax=Emticicia oligotrophica TaxID=312279 RepID=UPI00273C44A5|nr:type II toxin-antitoxin system RelE/ParE family toxin [Emticicia oligotrophica]
MKYEVIIKPSVFKDLSKLQDEIVEKIFEKIEQLAENPRPSGCKKLKNSKQINSNYKSLYRIRFTDYRIVYAIEDSIITVTVVAVGHRREIYE